MADITSKIDLDNLLASIGNPVLAPAQYTLLAYLSTLVSNGITASTLFTALNSTNLNLSKADLDTIVTNTAPILTALNSANINSSKTDLDTIVTNTTPILTALNSTNINSSKIDLDNLITQLTTLNNTVSLLSTSSNQLLQTNPFFNVLLTIIRPNNTTAYVPNASINNYVTSTDLYWAFGIGNANKLVQIDEVNIFNTCQNSPLMTPTIYISPFAFTPIGNGDNMVPQFTYLTEVVYMETVVGSIMIKIPGYSGNINILKSTILNVNIKQQCDSNGSLHALIVTSSAYTPQPDEQTLIYLKGRYL